MRRFLSLAIALLALGVLLGCRKSAKPSSDKIQIVVTIPPLADFCRQIGGARVQVTNLLPPGVSPHTFEPTPSQARAAAQADLVVRIGLDADHWLESLLPPNVPVIAAAELEGIDLIGGEGTAHHDEHTREEANPHVWLDPHYAGLICKAISEELVNIDPQGSVEYDDNLNNYLARLDSLDARIDSTLAPLYSRQYVSFHPAFIYFAARYHLERVGSITESAGKEPTPKSLEELIQAIKKAGVKAIFAEPQLSPKAAEVIAAETDARVLYLDPLGSESETYIELMERNLQVFLEAMASEVNDEGEEGE